MQLNKIVQECDMDARHDIECETDGKIGCNENKK